jgi:glycosyltransferase involved in cell wall biosynthesis
MLRARTKSVAAPSSISSLGVGNWAPTDHDLTILIPAFNEDHRLGRTLQLLEAFLDQTQINYRVLVIDDGSQDETARFTDSMGFRFTTLQLSAHRGKGAAVRAGMLSATGSIIAFTDADLPFELHSMVNGYELIRRGQCEVVFGARDIAGSASRASRRLSRRLATKLFRLLTTSLICSPVSDTQCGLKLFSRTAALKIFSQTKIDGFAFDAEVVYLTSRLKLPYQKVAVKLLNEYGSSLSLSSQAIPMVRDVFRIWQSARHDRRLALVRTPGFESTLHPRSAA